MVLDHRDKQQSPISVLVVDSRVASNVLLLKPHQRLDLATGWYPPLKRICS